SIDDPVAKYIDFPERDKNPDPRKSKITIRHLITMSTGWDCNDWDKKSKGQEDKVYKKKDLINYTLNLPIINDPGAKSNYCTMGVLLTKEIIQRTSGIPLDEFAKKLLFEPLGITQYRWGHTSESRKMILASKRLYMKPRDLAKIGILVKNKGKWKDQTIVSEKWINELSTPQTKITGLDYGFLWWRLPLQSGEKVWNSLMATGNGGQYIIIIEELDLMAVFTGGAYNSDQDKLPFAIMNRVVIPSVK
ncbi:MAG: serine hydrolase, partial [Bacteroidota bacterium]